MVDIKANEGASGLAGAVDLLCFGSLVSVIVLGPSKGVSVRRLVSYYKLY